MNAPKVPEPVTVDGAAVLDRVETFLARFVAYPCEAARIAHALWIAHAWLMDRWDSTPRIAFLSPEPGSGKSRALEVTEPLVPRPVHAVNTSPAYLFRKVSDASGPPTILYDEIDTVFGPKAKDNEDTRGMLNAGHRKGAMAGRCVVRGNNVETEELPAYCAVALAGLNDLPDTIMTRSVVVRMRRRAPAEHVEPWRARINHPQAQPIADALADWTDSLSDALPWPDMPAKIVDRDADVWEALLVVADTAGGKWPSRARAAAVKLVSAGKDNTPSLGVLLLTDLAGVFVTAKTGQLPTQAVLEALHKLDESPWADLRGKALDARNLSRRLGTYGIKPVQVWLDGKNVRGYWASDLLDPCRRYCAPETVAKLETVAHADHAENPLEALGTLDSASEQATFLADLADLADSSCDKSEGETGNDLHSCPLCGTPTRPSRAGHRTLCLACSVADVTATLATETGDTA